MTPICPDWWPKRYRNSRIVAFFNRQCLPAAQDRRGGASETTPVGPVGEYAQSALGRERMFEYGSSRWGTAVAILV